MTHLRPVQHGSENGLRFRTEDHDDVRRRGSEHAFVMECGAVSSRFINANGVRRFAVDDLGDRIIPPGNDNPTKDILGN